MQQFTNGEFMNKVKFPPPSDEIVALLNMATGYISKRRAEYGKTEEQLDALFHDIDLGLFGEVAKSGKFYAHIKEIKDSNPKPENLDELKALLDTRIAEDVESMSNNEPNNH